MCQLLTSKLPKTLKLPLQTTREDFQNKRFRNLSRMLRNTKNKTRRSEERLKPKTDFKATV